MRVLIACDWFLKYAAAQARALQAEGVETGVVCRTHAKEFGDSVEERQSVLEGLREAGVAVFELAGRMASARTMPDVLRKTAAWKPDVLHGQDNYDPRLLALSWQRPTVLTIHDPFRHPGAPSLGWAGEAVRRTWIRRAHRIVVHGAALRNALGNGVDQRRVAVIPHGVAVVDSPTPCPQDRAVLFFGRLEMYKGLGILLDAMRRVWETLPDVRLIVAGKGPEAALIPSGPRIEALIGYLPEDRVQDLFRKASLVVLPYVEASQSGVGCIAVGMGIPVVVTDVGALPELVPGPSFVVPSGDYSQLADTIARYVDHDLSLRQAVLAYARDRLSWQAVARKSVALYEEILARPKALGSADVRVQT